MSLATLSVRWMGWSWGGGRGSNGGGEGSEGGFATLRTILVSSVDQVVALLLRTIRIDLCLVLVKDNQIQKASYHFKTTVCV